MNIVEYHKQKEKEQNKIAIFMWVIIGLSFFCIMPLLSYLN